MRDQDKNIWNVRQNREKNISANRTRHTWQGLVDGEGAVQEEGRVMYNATLRWPHVQSYDTELK